MLDAFSLEPDDVQEIVVVLWSGLPILVCEMLLEVIQDVWLYLLLLSGEVVLVD